jgi:mono/diheme cytochrome c family protein
MDVETAHPRLLALLQRARVRRAHRGTYFAASRRLARALGAGLLIAIVGCGGAGHSDGASRVDSAPPGPVRDTIDPQVGDAAQQDVTPAMVLTGDSVFHGRRGNGLCFTCHGENAKGTQLAPDLTDDEWLNTDGSYSGIVTTIRAGVANPKQYPNLMPPMGGGTLSEPELRAVAAYVFRLRRSS